MLKEEHWVMIKSLKNQGFYQKDIALTLDVHPKTIQRALRREGVPANPRPQRGSKLDPYKDQIDELLSQGVWSSMIILRELQKEGYNGGQTILREYITPKRRLRPRRATVHFEGRVVGAVYCGTG